jgi:hypothetical protein
MRWLVSVITRDWAMAPMVWWKAAVPQAIAAGAYGRVGFGPQRVDPGGDDVELAELSVGAAECCDAGDAAFEAAEAEVEVLDLVGVVAGHDAADLRHDLDHAVGRQPAQRLHYRLLAHAELDAQVVGR